MKESNTIADNAIGNLQVGEFLLNTKGKHMHEGVKYTCRCRQCDLKFTFRENLARHQKEFHEGVKRKDM